MRCVLLRRLGLLYIGEGGAETILAGQCGTNLSPRNMYTSNTHCSEVGLLVLGQPAKDGPKWCPCWRGRSRWRGRAKPEAKWAEILRARGPLSELSNAGWNSENGVRMLPECPFYYNPLLQPVTDLDRIMGLHFLGSYFDICIHVGGPHALVSGPSPVGLISQF